MKFIRWSFVIPTVIIIAAVIIFNIMFFDVILKKAFISTGEMIFGAKVEINSLKTSFSKMSIAINGLKCANRNDYFKNLIDIDYIKFDVRFTPLLRKKFIIDEMTVSGLKWQTERKTSGQLPPKKEKKFEKKKKDGMFSKMFAAAKAKTVSEFNQLPSVTAYKEIEDLINNFDVNKLIDKAQLQSVKEIEQKTKELQTKYETYQKKIEGYDINKKAEEIKAQIDEISKTKVSGLADVAKAAKNVEKLKESKKEIETIINDLNSIKKDVSENINFVKEAKNSINKDIENISSKLSIPSLNLKNISRILFGNQWVNRVETVMYYMALIKQYMPEKKEEVQEKQRARGRDILFKLKQYPTLLISLINVSGSTNDNLDFAGVIKNICSSPSMIANPLTVEIKGDNKVQALHISGLFDHRTDNSKDTLAVQVSGLSAKMLNIPQNDYLPLVDTGKMKVNADFALLNNSFDCKANINLTEIQKKNLNDIEGNLKYLAEVTNSITNFSVSASAKYQSEENMDFNITSDIDTKISGAISKLFSSKITAAKEKISKELNKIVTEQTKNIQDEINKQKNGLLGQISSQTNILNDIEKTINEAISKSTKKSLF